jgi:hypothetical protein
LQIPGFPAVPLTVHATPHWHFDFGDGTSLDSDVPGTPYDGTDPVEHPEHYVTATYHQTGQLPVTVTVTWSATALRHDTGQTLTLPGTATRTATVIIPVRQAKSELVGGPDS